MRHAFAVLTAMAMMHGCKTTTEDESSGVMDAQNGGTVKTVTGQDADDFMRALQDAGVQPPAGLVGSLRLVSELIQCSAPVVPNPKPGCNVTFGGSSNTAPAEAAKVFHRILLANGGLVQNGLVGSSNVRASQIECSRPVTPQAQGTCTFKVGASGQPGPDQGGGGGGQGPTPVPATVTVDGNDGNTLMNALSASGVKDPQAAVGSQRLSAKDIQCSAPVVPNPVPQCTVKAGNKTLKPSKANAKKIYSVLLAHGARVNNGMVGSSLVAAKNVECSRPVVPQAKASCSFVVAGQSQNGGGNGGQPPVNPPVPGGQIAKQISGADGNEFIRALQDSGVKDTTGAVGSLQLHADAVECSAAVVPNPVPDCRVDFGGSTLSAPTAAAKNLYRLLVKYGAVIKNGPVGSSRAVANAIDCSRAVVPQAQGSCTIYVMP